MKKVRRISWMMHPLHDCPATDAATTAWGRPHARRAPLALLRDDVWLIMSGHRLQLTWVYENSFIEGVRRPPPKVILPARSCHRREPRHQARGEERARQRAALYVEQRRQAEEALPIFQHCSLAFTFNSHQPRRPPPLCCPA